MQCPNCGHENTQTSRFCARCGFDVNAPAEPVAANPDPWGPPAGTSAPIPAPADPGPAAPASPWGQPPGPSAPAPSAPAAGPPGDAAGSTPLPPYRPPDPNPYAPPAPYVPPPPGQYAPPGSPPGPGGYPPPGGYPQQGGYPPAYPGAGYYGPTTNGLAVAALVLGLVGWTFCGIGSVLAVIFGFVSQSQITASQGRQTGAGMAKAGIILGFVGIGLVVLWFTLALAAGDGSSG